MRSPGSICSAIPRRPSLAPITLKPCSRVARKFSSDPVSTHVLATWGQPSYCFAGMADEELHLIGPDEIAYRLDLTPAQLKITWTALKSFLDDFGHDERDVHELVREVLGKLPDEHSIRAVDLS